MEDLEGSKKFAFELFVSLCFDIFAIQPDFLAQSIATVLYSFVMSFFLQFLYLE